jgi:hypothetical protein
VQRFSEEHYPLWNALSKIDCSTNAQEFWKTIKKFRRKESDDVFPNVMTNGNIQYKSKQSIKEAIGQYFSDVSLNKDTEATLFKNQFPSHQEQQPKPETVNQTPPQDLTIKELSDSIQHQQNHKKGGPDDTTYECFLSTC